MSKEKDKIGQLPSVSSVKEVDPNISSMPFRRNKRAKNNLKSYNQSQATSPSRVPTWPLSPNDARLEQETNGKKKRKKDGSPAPLAGSPESRAEPQPKVMNTLSSTFRGVSWHKLNQKWKANISINGKTKHVGYFDDEETAATKFDEHAAPLGRAVNFPSEGQAQATMGKSSKFRGVHWHKSHQKWQAKITMDGILTHLGYFDDDETAARKYDEHAARIGRPINFPPEGDNAPVDKVSGGCSTTTPWAGRATST